MSYLIQIDPELPEERKRHIVEDSDAKFILTNDAYFENFRGPVYSLDSANIQERIASQDSSEISIAKLDSLAYLLYTSGRSLSFTLTCFRWRPQVQPESPKDVCSTTVASTGRLSRCANIHKTLQIRALINVSRWLVCVFSISYILKPDTLNL